MKKVKYSDVNYKHGSRKVTKAMAAQMSKRVAKGETLTAIAEKFGVTPYTVKYNTNMDFRQAEIARCC